MGEMEGSSADLERALLELGPILGVSVKQETLDDATAPLTIPEPGEDAPPATPDRAPPADSLESPPAVRSNPWGAVKCAFCQQTLVAMDGSPKLMECLHSACEGCVKVKIEEKNTGRDFLGAERLTIACGACKFPCQPCNMIEQQFVVEKAAAEASGGGGGVTVSEQNCSSCSEHNPVTSWCVECADYICDVCVQAHQRLKITKDHTIKSKEEAAQEIAANNPTAAAHDMFCREHTQERLSLFCETCDRLTCRDCQLLHHRDHKYQFSTEMASQARSSISSLLAEVSYKRVLLGSAMKVIEDRQTAIADKKRQLVHDITQMVVKLTNTINTRGKQLVLRLNEVCDSKQHTLTEKKVALEQLSAITDHCIDFVNGAMSQGSDTAILYTKKQVTQHLRRIKSRRADIPNPEIPVRISLAVDKVPDLVKVLSTFGAIVVDGRVDTGAPSPHSQGPYHPPGTPPAPPAPPGPAPPAPSAVAALQQVAMHQMPSQGYVNNRSGGASPSTAPPPYPGVMSMHHQMRQQQNNAAAAAQVAAGNAMMSALGVRGASPALRHPHVTSTTHPHHMQGMNELNLRGLLNQTQYMRQNHAMQAAAYQQVMGAAYNNYASPPRGRPGPRTPSPAPPLAPLVSAAYQQPQQLAKWHIPQQAAGMYEGVATAFPTAAAVPNNDFKITLNRQPSRTNCASAVTSTNPKTPSPSLNGVATEATVSIDKLCQESVHDLMRTIAKLDSNGVQVLPETQAKTAPSPHVHSSTDDPANKPSVLAGSSNDPNEDWCAVCMDGGELMCCDKCPKVFHQYCHIPTIDKLPELSESWQCLLCVNISELPPDPATGERRAAGLSPRQQKIIERITLELYCQYEISMAFREPVPAENLDYHSKIASPMSLDIIRAKLQPRCATRYTHVSEMVCDVRLMFRNACEYNPVDSQIYKDAKRLEEFFDRQLEKWLPEYAYYDPGADQRAAAKRPRHSE